MNQRSKRRSKGDGADHTAEVCCASRVGIRPRGKKQLKSPPKNSIFARIVETRVLHARFDAMRCSSLLRSEHSPRRSTGGSIEEQDLQSLESVHGSKKGWPQRREEGGPQGRGSQERGAERRGSEGRPQSREESRTQDRKAPASSLTDADSPGSRRASVGSLFFYARQSVSTPVNLGCARCRVRPERRLSHCGGAQIMRTGAPTRVASSAKTTSSAVTIRSRGFVRSSARVARARELENPRDQRVIGVPAALRGS